MKIFSTRYLLFSFILLFTFSCAKQELDPDDTSGDPNHNKSSNSGDRPIRAIYFDGFINGIPFTGRVHIHEFLREGGKRLSNGKVLAVISIVEIIGGPRLSEETASELKKHRFTVPVKFDQGRGNVHQVSGSTKRDCPYLHFQLDEIFFRFKEQVIESKGPIPVKIDAAEENDYVKEKICQILQLVEKDGSLKDLVKNMNRILDVINR
jgi:hypothetical protein